MPDERQQTNGPCPPRRVAVLGAAGNVGKAACAGLIARRHTVRGIDVIDQPPPDVTDFHLIDITNGPALKHALRDMDTVIHLAGNLVQGVPRDILLGPNFLGVWNIFDAAAASGATGSSI